MTDEEIQLKTQRRLQEYDDAVENVAPNYAELGRAAVAALDEFMAYWSSRPELDASPPASEDSESDMRKFIDRQLEWARHEKQRVIAQLPRPKP